MQWMFVFAGGGAGSICRYLMARQLNYTGQEYLLFPWGTFLANIASCLILGILIQKQFSHHMAETYRLLFITGFCGGFSTFSTFIYELQMYMQRGQLKMGFAYVAASILLGLVAMAGGYRISGLLPS